MHQKFTQFVVIFSLKRQSYQNNQHYVKISSKIRAAFYWSIERRLLYGYKRGIQPQTYSCCDTFATFYLPIKLIQAEALELYACRTSLLKSATHQKTP